MSTERLQIGARIYQVEAKDAILRELGAQKSTLLVMATGAGKTRTALMVCEALRGRGPILWLTHRQQLVAQTTSVVQKQTVLCVGIEMAEQRADWRRPIDIVVASQQSLASKDRRTALGMERFSLVVVDEAHHAAAVSWKAILCDAVNARILGLTATPNREDGVGLGKIFETIAYDYPIEKAISDGFHKRVLWSQVEVDGVDLSHVRRTRGGDLNEVDLGRLTPSRFSAPSAIIVDKGRVLLALRPPGKSFAGCWETPGGKAEPGETDREALARKLREELGVEATIGPEVADVLLDPPVTSKSYRIKFYLCAVQGEPKPLASEKLGWFLPGEIAGLALTPATLEIAKAGHFQAAIALDAELVGEGEETNSRL